MTKEIYIQVAPMEGVVDFKVRELLTEIGGIDRTVTEFVRVTDRLLPSKTFYKYAPELMQPLPTEGGSLSGRRSHTKMGVPVFVQLLGSDPSVLSENAHQAVELGAVGIDLNFGCPAKTVNRHDGGATLLKNPERIFKIVDRLRTSLPPSVPVTAKVRLGFADKLFHKDIAQAVDSAGANQLVVHARTRNEGYRPPAHWEYIGFMNDAVTRVPVVANGDIWTVEDYHRCVSVSGVRDVALGRALMAMPDLALQIRKVHASQFTTQCEQKREAGTWQMVFRRFVWPLFDYYFEQSQGLATGRLKQTLKQLGRNYPEALSLFEEVKRETVGIRLKMRLLQERALTEGPTAPRL